MKQLWFNYSCVVQMDAPVHDHRFTLRCVPISDVRQKISMMTYSVTPNDRLTMSQDQWRNVLLYGVSLSDHTRFGIKVSGKAMTGLTDRIPEPEPARCMPFMYSTPLTAADEQLRQFAMDPAFTEGPVLERVRNIMHAVHSRILYVPRSTTTATTAAQAFTAGSGVCQDYAHIMISMLRAQGLPARYVVGMMIGEGQSHAWVEVLHAGAWYAFDPTNDIEVTDAHIKMAHGLDYNDCMITRGVFRGFCNQQTIINAAVTDMDQ